ncbi:MAG: M23 family metallopeptidase [Parafilimonas terrae]|nr:M23 family metallopeptidase [Parafilimonas terrae]
MRGRTGTGADAGRRRRLRIGFSTALVLALAAVIGLAPVPQSAQAADYPSWQDVQNAIADVKANEALQAQLTAQVQQLQQEQAAAEELSRQKGEIYGKAQDSVDEQQYKVDQLQAQVDTAKASADAAKKQVDGLLSELAKPGKSDLTSSLISHPGDTKDLLYKLGAAAKLTQTSQDLYAKAIEDRNTVQTLTDQANVARQELERRREIAKKAFEDAQAAAAVAQEKTAAANTHLEEAKAQIVALQQKSMQVQADYAAGLAAAQAAAGAEVNLRTGWARPARGPISSGFGMRYHPIYHTWKLHSGTDIAAGCGAPIFAGHAGTVVYAGWYSDLGNFIEIDHGNGLVTGYGHIVNGGIMVSNGQEVKAGQQIAKVGSTGGSTGCHLHYMVRTGGLWGPVQDPVPFMRGQGMPLG